MCATPASSTASRNHLFIVRASTKQSLFAWVCKDIGASEIASKSKSLNSPQSSRHISTEGVAALAFCRERECLRRKEAQGSAIGSARFSFCRSRGGDRQLTREILRIVGATFADPACNLRIDTQWPRANHRFCSVVVLILGRNHQIGRYSVLYPPHQSSVRISRKEGQRFTACRSMVSRHVGPVLMKQDVLNFLSETNIRQ